MAEAGALEVVAEAIVDGIVIADAESQVVWCNRAAAAMFGWTPQDAVGRELTELMPERFRAAHLHGLSRVVAGGEPRLIGRGPVEVEALGADGQEIPVELTVNRWESDAGETRFVAVLRDISARRRLEREREAQFAVVRALASAPTTEAAAGAVMEALGAVMDWEFGAAWLLGDDGEELACARVWSQDADATAAFREATQATTFPRGIGLPGRAWAERRPVWLRDVAREDEFPRVTTARKAGLHGAVAMPIADGDTFVGVLEFFSGSLAAPDAAFETILESAGEQFVQFFRRKQAEDELAAQRLAQRQTVEINDNIIHWLVQISQALDAGDQRAAERATHEALQHASRIITELQLLPQPSTR